MATAIKVRERPILFSGQMVRAILDGRKTQTRRVVRLPAHVVSRGIHPRMDEWVSNRYTNGSGQYVGGNPRFTGDQPPGLLVTCNDHTCQRVPCPYGQPGDRLYVRETWIKPYSGDTRASVLYRADGPEYLSMASRAHNWGAGYPWKPSIHMPKAFVRIWLEVTVVRVERVQDITGSEAIAEGLDRDEHGGWLPGGYMGPTVAFEQLWDSLNAKRGYSWESNPWVWVIEFAPAAPTQGEET